MQLELTRDPKVTRHCAGQDPGMTQGAYTDPATGIDFTTWSADPDSDGDGAFTFGLALPEDAATRDATEYIGLLVRFLSHPFPPSSTPVPRVRNHRPQ